MTAGKECVSTKVYGWDKASARWKEKYPGAGAGFHFAFADFGTEGATAADFDPTKLDGIAEVVGTGDGVARLTTLSGQVLMSQSLGVKEGGGPPTIADFDGDGRPEFASAGATAYRVFDLDCAPAKANPACVGDFVRWSQLSQDASSAMTGSSIFDFEGDGKAEAVYADECFTRIYEGATGEVLYSAYRSSCTWFENAVVADPDRDSNTEILVGSNTSCGTICAANVPDPIHRGIRCEDASTCGSGVCSEGFCRCTSPDQCGEAFACADPPAGTPGTGKTCRAQHPGTGQTGLRVRRHAV